MGYINTKNPPEYQSVGRKGIHFRLNLKDGKKEESYTLPETAIAPENRLSQKEISSSNHPFSGAMLVSGRVTFPYFLP